MTPRTPRGRRARSGWRSRSPSRRGHRSWASCFAKRPRSMTLFVARGTQARCGDDRAWIRVRGHRRRQSRRTEPVHGITESSRACGTLETPSQQCDELHSERKRAYAHSRVTRSAALAEDREVISSCTAALCSAADTRSPPRRCYSVGRTAVRHTARRTSHHASLCLRAHMLIPRQSMPLTDM